MERFARKIIVSISRWALRVSGVIIWVMAAFITVDVTLRFALNRPLIGVYESAEVGFLMVVFLTLAWAALQKRHMSVTLVSSRFKGKGKHALDLLSNLLTIGFFGIILWYGTRDFIRAWTIGDVRQGLFQVPWVLPLAGLVIGCIIMLLVLLSDSLQHVQGVLRSGIPREERSQ